MTEERSTQPGTALEDFFENAHCGFLILDAKGAIVRTNRFFKTLCACEESQLRGRKFSSLLTIGGQVFWETHLWPLLKMQGSFNEALLEFGLGDGRKIQVLVNASEQKEAQDLPHSIKLIVFGATDRHRYEENLRNAKTVAENNLEHERELSALREQFIAVLGHDLRNPLGAIMAAGQLLDRSVTSEQDRLLITSLNNSASRMKELISNIMDFARTRLGSGLGLQLKEVDLSPVLSNLVHELQTIWKNREVVLDIRQPLIINCDKDRISQLFSNLLGNALSHGSKTAAVRVMAQRSSGNFELSVSNEGVMIPAHKISTIFEPFTRETERPSQQGLGLGLYICSEIARAHGGTLSVESTDSETSFSLSMPS